MIGKPIHFKLKQTGDRTLWGTVEDEVYIMVDDYKHMIQRFKFAKEISNDDSEYGYRTCYYTLDKKEQKIKWDQYTQSIINGKGIPRTLGQSKGQRLADFFKLRN